MVMEVSVSVMVILGGSSFSSLPISTSLGCRNSFFSLFQGETGDLGSLPPPFPFASSSLRLPLPPLPLPPFPFGSVSVGGSLVSIVSEGMDPAAGVNDVWHQYLLNSYLQKVES